ncbi:DUF4224 domain-containing protein [Arsenophonus nasoniae]|uniref:DUF4224 domain-containing protein n=1 Tax=Arsenophonus nasoniae TaxID=638 RepID=A0AA95K8T9_9GAMM|nr:DUF4224 domain-containing protein [Arsenophonus nasoniae]WGL96693.1 DUF4224 domain-containing protein [Arsenophonus nasoniae]
MTNRSCMVITDEEMKELTGYQKPSKQCKVLEEAGIFFIKRPDGRPKTTWNHFNNPLSKATDINFTEKPDFGAM